MSGAWEEFVTRHARMVLDSALRVLANSADADDVSQEVFLEIFRNGRLSEFVAQPALLRTVATRRALDRLRQRKPLYELDGRELNPREFEPSDYAIANESDRRLRDALADLPPREGEVFCLSVLEGHSAEAVAELLKISQGAVAKSLCSARARLSEAFGKTKSEAGR